MLLCGYDTGEPGGTMKLQDKLKEIKERCEAATEGPWKVSVWRGSRQVVGPMDELIGEMQGTKEKPTNHDAQLVAHARTDVPMLLELVNELLFIFDDKLADCDCDVDYCCPKHQFEVALGRLKLS